MKYIIYTGFSGFPKGMAQFQRQLLIAKGLIELDCNVLVLCRYGVHQQDGGLSIEITGNFEGVDYKYCSGTQFRPDAFLKRNFLKVKGFIIEFFTIIHKKIVKQADSMIITSNSFAGILYYTQLAKILHITSIVDQVEYWSTQKKGIIKKIDSFFNNHFYFYLADKVIVISDYLFEKVKGKKPNKSVIKIPVLCDFNKFNDSKVIKSNNSYKPYFLFCGSSAYYELILFILKSFAKLNNKIELLLIVGGNHNDIDKINNYIKVNNFKSIFLKNNIPYIELLKYYKNSLALLIPLRPTLQDLARFPHKLGEYTASGRPIISTNFGEVSNYFKDGYNAYLSNSYNIIEYSNKMLQVINDVKEADKIGIQSYKTGLKEFDYKKNAMKIYDFIFSKLEKL